METVTLNSKAQRRLMILNEMERGSITASQAAQLMGISVRQARRLLAGYRRDGAAALVHGNRGRPSPHAVSQAVREQVVVLARGPYDGANHTHLTELLAEREGLHLSRSSVRRILLVEGIRTPRRRRPPRHRRRRERLPQEGMLLQVDGSRHDWLEGRAPWLTLIGGIDDATGTVPFACFREQEDSHGYLRLLEGVIRRKGVPLALYSDRHSTFVVNAPRETTIEEDLAGQKPRTQVGRALDQLGIELFLARSPQAKGRIERLWGTFQDRLLTELRLAGACTIDDANAVLEVFLARFNSRFAVTAADPDVAYRPAPPASHLANVLCFQHPRTVAADNTVRLAGRTVQLLPTPQRSSYARARVIVHERLDGELAVSYHGLLVPSHLTDPSPATLRSSAPNTTAGRETAAAVSLPAKPGPNHPWRRPFKSPR
jgi:transposase